LEDPTGQSDGKFLETMDSIEKNILELRKTVLEMQTHERSHEHV
jgi:hypothetical protein